MATGCQPDTFIYEQIIFGLHTHVLSVCTCEYLATPQYNHPPSDKHAHRFLWGFVWLADLLDEK